MCEWWLDGGKTVRELARFLLATVPEEMRQSLLGPVELGLGVSFATVHNGTGAVQPHAQAGRVLFDLVGKRLGEDRAVSREHKRRVVVQGSEGLEEASMTDGVVCGGGGTVAIGIPKRPLGAHRKPEEGDELACPNGASEIAAVELEVVVVRRKELLLESAPFDG